MITETSNDDNDEQQQQQQQYRPHIVSYRYSMEEITKRKIQQQQRKK